MTGPGGRIVEAGDSALVCEIGHATGTGVGVDADVNACAVAIAAAVRKLAIPGVRDVVPAFHSVTVFFESLGTDVPAVVAALDEAMTAPPSGSPGKAIDVPVVYGGKAGPDLAEVAAFAGCSPDEVIERHAATTYRVCMLGFLPGFAYMASVDTTIAAPRHATPRLRVPAGSVGIAGLQTGIYPRESPGGWQIIGRTALDLFDPDRTPPALFAPGDRVRFIPTDGADEEAPVQAETGSGSQAALGAGRRTVTVLQPGLLTTVQDAGRWGHQHDGVSVAGPMDVGAYRLANALVGNRVDAAALEATWLGPELRMEQDTRVAVTGADLQATLDGADVPLGVAVRCGAGSVLRFGARQGGVRAYVAFDGGVAVPDVLGSRATHLPSGLGGVEGRQLIEGDRVPLGEPPQGLATDVGRAGGNVGAAGLDALASAGGAARRVRAAGGARLRVLPGPQASECGPAVLEALQRARYTVSPESNRMGYRLMGGAQIQGVSGGEMISASTFVGGVQLPPSGDPILLMGDRQTTGGYPQIAVVITADLPLAGQLGPGDWIEFVACTRDDAVAALRDPDGTSGVAG
ncbi:MAG: 5-oxoprolinase subunit PxpB [Acidobacteria bacterium]|nr:5-oxoprolinase subunit PxpB [Acidobacteriota bacterium]